MSEKKKVLIFLQSEVGGAERVSVTIGKKLDPVSFDVSFCAVGPWACKISDFIPAEKFYGHLKQANPFRLLVGLYRTIRKESPDIVFSSTMYISTKLLLLQPLFPKTKFVVRSENNFFTFNRKQQLMIRVLYRHAEKIIAQTDEMNDELAKIAKLPSSKIVTIQNPLDFESIGLYSQEKSPFNDEKKKYFVASGRFDHAKGFDILVKAFSLVLKKIENAELYIVGRNDGPNEEYYLQIKQIIEHLGLKDRVYCIGYQKNPYRFVKHANCFVLSSRNEGLPNVLIEALFMGTPVAAATCIPVIGRIVKHGKTGFLAEPENVKSLANAMVSACSLGRVRCDYPLDTMLQFNKLFKSLF